MRCLPTPPPALAAAALGTLRLWRAGLAAVALGLGVNPTNKTCTTSGGGGHGHGPSPPGPPPPPKPHVPHGSCSALMPGMSLVYGSRANSWPTTGSAAACETLCKANATCTYGTWHDEHQGHYKNACMLETDQRYSPHRQDGHPSFLCNMSATLQEANELASSAERRAEEAVAAAAAATNEAAGDRAALEALRAELEAQQASPPTQL